MSYSEIFTENLIVLTKAFFRRNQDPQVYQDVLQMIRGTYFEYYLNFATVFLHREGEFWKSNFETENSYHFQDINRFNTYLLEFQRGVLYNDLLPNDYARDIVAYKYIGYCTKIAVAGYHAESVGLLGIQDLTRPAIRQILTFFLNS